MDNKRLTDWFAGITAELDRAVMKFPTFPIDPIHAAGIVVEEAGELAQAATKWTYEGGWHEDMVKEAIQVGAMALRFLMHVHRMSPRPSEQERTDDRPTT